jgi:hypothetical protein
MNPNPLSPESGSGGLRKIANPLEQNKLAKRLEQRFVDNEAESKRRGDLARAAIDAAQMPNTRSLDELGLDALQIKLEPWTPVIFYPPIPCPPRGAEEFSGFKVGDKWVLAWRAVPGLRLPPHIHFSDFHPAPATTVPPLSASDVAAIRYPRADGYCLFRALLTKFGSGVRGPIGESQWTTEGHTAAQALVAQWSHLMAAPGTLWMCRHFLEVVLRGFLLRDAPAIVRDALAARGVSVDLADLEKSAADCTSGGIVSAGAFLPSNQQKKGSK